MKSAPDLHPSCQQSFLTTSQSMLPTSLNSSLVWHSVKPGRVSSDFWGHWLHPEFLSLTADAFRNMLQSIVTLFFFFPRIIIIFFFPRGSKKSQLKVARGTTSEETHRIFLFLFFVVEYSQGLLEGLPFHSHPWMQLWGRHSSALLCSALLCSAPQSCEWPMKWLTLQPLLMYTDPLKSLQRGCLPRGCRYKTVKYDQYRLYYLMIQTLFLMTKQRHFFYIVDTDPLA